MINSAVFEGRLTRKTNFRVFHNNKTGRDNPSLLFTIAVQRNFKNQQGQYDSDFFNCRASGNSANFLNQYVGIGDTIVASGELHNDNYQSNRYRDSQGQPANMHSVQFTVFNVSLAGRSRKNQMRNGNAPMPNPSQQGQQPRPRNNNFGNNRGANQNPMANNGPANNRMPQSPKRNGIKPPMNRGANKPNNNAPQNPFANGQNPAGNNQSPNPQGNQNNSFKTKNRINVTSKSLPF